MRLLLILFLFISCGALAQETVTQQSAASEDSHAYFAGDLLVTSFPMMKHNYTGINIDLKFFTKPKWMFGLTFNFNGGEVTKELNYSFAEPVLNHYEGGVLARYNFIRSNTALLGLSLCSGVVVNVYGDNSTRDEDTQELIDKVTATQFYIAPGLEFNFRLFPEMNVPEIYFTAKIRYLLPAGYPRYGAPSDFTGYYLGAGVSFVGLISQLDEQ